MCQPCGKERYSEWTVERLAKAPSPPEKKTCNSCLVEKTAVDFRRNTFSPDGLMAKCIRCKKISQLYRKYGIDEPTYLGLFESQDYKCLICTRQIAPFTRYTHVDHYDCSGYKDFSPELRAERVRGLLCCGCNTGIGGLGHSEKNLASAIDYLQAYKRRRTDLSV